MRIVDGTLRLEATDLSNFLACRHLTRLDLLAAEGRARPDRPYDVGLDLLAERGATHEARVLAEYKAGGLNVADIPRGEVDETVAATRNALIDDAQVIYQGVLQSAPGDGKAPLLGRPDFIVRPEASPGADGDQGDAGHEIVDAKLARSAKARAVLQTAFYSQLLTELQDQAPREMHLALGNGEVASFRVSEIAAYERRIRQMLEELASDPVHDNPPSDPYPEPVEHCAICRWSANCEARRHADDDLSLVAGMPTRQRLALKERGIATRRGFAALEALPKLSRGDPSSLERAHLQARLQVESEEAGDIKYELLEPAREEEDETLTPNRGLLALPEPSPGDLFFDIEGARYYSEDGREFGLQYLFGVVDTSDLDEDGRPRYTAIWGFDRDGEKRAFEKLIDFITVRREKYPGLHVYHYNHYEPTSIEQLTTLHGTREESVGRLMGRFATHEDEVDDLFRLGVFVDLYRVVRQGLRAGVESYSIKRLEPLVGYERQVSLDDATAHLISFEMSLDEGTAAADVEGQRVVAGYNEDDCCSTLVLREWLEARRDELEAKVGEHLPRPVVKEEAHATEDPVVAQIKADLLSDVPPDPDSRSREQSAKALLADLLEWHRREAKPAWWRFFRLKRLSSTELVDEREAIGELSGGEIVEHVKLSVVRRFAFPPQEHGFSVGDHVHDPATGKRWTVYDLDDQSGTLDLKIGAKNAEPLPKCVIAGGPVNTDVLAARLADLGARVALDGLVDGDAASEILLRRRPLAGGDKSGPLRRQDEAPVDAAVRLILGLNGSYLPIQGPPGSGKTYTGAQAIRALIADDRTVGIVGPSHAVIHNMLDEVVEQAGDAASSLRIGQRADAENPFLHDHAESLKYPALQDRLREHDLDIAAGTAWTWAREDFRDIVDTLIVDEAGQMSLADMLAISGAARNVVFLGDPQQLAQPSQAAHPPGSGVSGLEYILDGRATMPDDAGLFLDETYRMHPDLCKFTSDLFYDGRLGGVDGLERQTLETGDTRIPRAGLGVVEVEHVGNTNSSPEEAGEVVQLAQALLASTWVDHKGERHDITAKDVLIVTPYNAQIRAIEQAMRDAGVSGLKVGTVDKFQGREAPAVIYSMATSSASDAPRGMEFLFDLHRLNVATSRARATAIIVGSPDLVRVYCGTPRQMVLANALCVAWESIAA